MWYLVECQEEVNYFNISTLDTLQQQKEITKSLRSTHFHLYSLTRLDHNLVPLLGFLDRLGVPEDLIQLLERPALRLDHRRPHRQPLQRMEDQEDGISLPSNVLQRNRRRIRVDEARQPGHEALERHALGTDLVVEHLRRVERLERGPGEGEEDAVEEDHRDECVAGTVPNVAVGLGGEDVDRNVDEHGQEGAPEEELAAAELVDGEAAGDAAEEGEDGVEGVEQELLVRARDADVLQDRGHEVADDGSADELREGRDEEDEPDPVQGGAGVEEGAVVPPALVGGDFDFVVDRVLDLVAFEFDDCGVGVAVAMEFDQDFSGFFRLAVGEEPAGRFGQRPDKGHDDEGWDGLQDDGDSPRPVRDDVACAVTRPTGR